MSLAAPTSAAGSTDLTATQLLALYNATGEMLTRRRVWRDLIGSGTVTTVIAQREYDLPDDFNRPISQTEWDTLVPQAMRGPATDQQWTWILAAGINTPNSYLPAFRLLNGQLVLSAAPTDVRELTYLYVSKFWCRTSAGDPKARATLDDDYAIFDDRLMVAGVKLRFFQAKGFDTTSFAADYQTILDDCMGQDSGAPILNMAGGGRSPLITVANLPESGYGS